MNRIRISSKQKQMLVRFVKTNPILETNCRRNDIKKRRLWCLITKILNSVPNGVSKPWKGWRKYWQALKRNFKKIKHTYTVLTVDEDDDFMDTENCKKDDKSEERKEVEVPPEIDQISFLDMEAINIEEVEELFEMV
ncbi:uncharacterized protein LOC126264635 [Aethina tumida]|uniref:uncharacterized protein LOC126264635 n=1 Tax=Aethina tumida TaxID=116153 RepID=UPI0021471D3B|nr:uncharacterized protein LOC126264635 [Aethina tumida]